MVHSRHGDTINDEIHMFVHVRWIGLWENLQEIIVNKILCGYLVCLLNQFNDKYYIYMCIIYIIIYIYVPGLSYMRLLNIMGIEFPM